MVAATATGLRRGLSVLVALGDDEALASGGLGVTRLAEVVGSEKSQVSRTLKVLGEYGFVDRDPATLAYRIGRRLFALAGRAAHAHVLAVARPALKQLVEDLAETAHLSLLQGSQVVTLLSETPNRAVQAAGWSGRTVPVSCTSSGRALLFDHDESDVRQLLRGAELDGAGPNRPRTVEELVERIRTARSRGFALVDEELEAGLVAVGAPVRDFRGRIVAAVNVSAPKFRFAERLEAAGEAVKDAADTISCELGWCGGGRG